MLQPEKQISVSCRMRFLRRIELLKATRGLELRLIDLFHYKACFHNFFYFLNLRRINVYYWSPELITVHYCPSPNSEQLVAPRKRKSEGQQMNSRSQYWWLPMHNRDFYIFNVSFKQIQIKLRLFRCLFLLVFFIFN